MAQILNKENVESAANVANPQDFESGNTAGMGGDDRPLDTSFLGTALGIANIGAGLYAGLKNISANEEADARQYRHQRELIDLQYENDIKKWQMQNEYNSPAAMRERLIAAGLNPNLITGMAGSTAAGAVGNSDVPAAFTRSRMEGVSQMINAMSNAVSQGSLIDSQVQLNKSAAVKNLADANATPQDVETRKGHLRVAEGNLNVQQKLLQETIRKNDAFILWNDKQIEEASARISNIAYQNKELSARTSLHDAEAALKKVQSETWAAESKARIAELYSRANLNKEHANLMAEQTITEFQTRAPRIAQILASTDSDIKRAQLLQGEFDAMAEEIFKSQYWTNAAKNGGVATDAVYTFERIIGDLGKVFHGGVGSYTHTSIK